MLRTRMQPALRGTLGQALRPGLGAVALPTAATTCCCRTPPRPPHLGGLSSPPLRGNSKGISTSRVVAMARPWRPSLDDVDRLSRGEGAKRRGTGSFHIPHRLSADERPVFESSKKKGYLAVRGTGARKAHARHGHPLPNSFRQWCDARGMPCIVIEQDSSGAGEDTVVVDLSPLRLLDPTEAAARFCDAAASLGLRCLSPDERGADDVPFDVSPVPMPGDAGDDTAGGTTTTTTTTNSSSSSEAGEGGSLNGSSNGSSSGSGSNGRRDLGAEVAAAAAAVAAQGGIVRALKEGGATNQDPRVQAGVQALQKLKANLAALEQQQQQQRQQQQPQEEEQHEQATSSSEETNGSSSGSNGNGRRNLGAEVAAAAAAVAAQGGIVRALKEGGATNQDPRVQAGVQTLQRLKAHLAALEQQQQEQEEEQEQASSSSEETNGSSSSGGGSLTGSGKREVLPDSHPFATAAIWQLVPRPLFFTGPRPAAKELAKRLVSEVAPAGGRR